MSRDSFSCLFPAQISTWLVFWFLTLIRWLSLGEISERFESMHQRPITPPMMGKEQPRNLMFTRFMANNSKVVSISVLQLPFIVS